MTSIQGLIDINLAGIPCAEAPAIKEQMTLALEKLNAIKIEDYNKLREKIPALLPTVALLKGKPLFIIAITLLSKTGRVCKKGRRSSA